MHRKSSIFPTRSTAKTAMFPSSWQHNHPSANQLSQKCLSLVAAIFSLGDSNDSSIPRFRGIGSFFKVDFYVQPGLKCQPSRLPRRRLTRQTTSKEKQPIRSTILIAWLLNPRTYKQSHTPLGFSFCYNISESFNL